MPSVLVTVVAPQRRLDLVIPSDTAISELLPEIVELCVDAAARPASARWAVGKLGDRPFEPERTLEECGVIDGALLYVRDMTSAVPAPPAPAPPPSIPVRDSQAPPPSYPTGPAVATTGRRAPARSAPAAASRPAAVATAPAPASPAMPPVRSAPPSISTGPGARAHPVPQAGGAEAYELTGAGLVLGILGVVVGSIGSIVLFTLRGSAGTGVMLAIAIVFGAGYAAWHYGVVAAYGKRNRIKWMTGLPLPPRLARARAQEARDPWKQQKLEKITALAEEFIYDLGRLLAGHDPELTYMTPKVAGQLRGMAAPFLATGDRMIANFGEVDLTVQWPGDQRSPIAATARFSDQSTRQTVRGENITPPRRTVVVELQVDAAADRIIDARVGSDSDHGF
jgi:hypothetical protein